MSAPVPVTDSSVYGDFAGLDALRKSARNHDPAAVREVAKQFESLFARMLIKSMRDAVGRDPIFGSDQTEAYQSMFDDQLSQELTRGHGLGLADMLVRQLQERGVSGAAAPASGSGSASASSSASTSVSTQTSAGTRRTAGAAASAPVTSAERQRFIGAVWPQAQQAGAALGVDPASLVAQAALESNWGRSVPRGSGGQSSNNLFGIKAGTGWSGPAVAARTQEVENSESVATSASFRAYGTPAESFADYVALLRSNPRYAAALNTGSNVHAFANALQRGGYATDPEYARKVSAIASQVSDTASRLALPTSPLLVASNGSVPNGDVAAGEPLKLSSARPITVGTGELL